MSEYIRLHGSDNLMSS